LFSGAFRFFFLFVSRLLHEISSSDPNESGTQATETVQNNVAVFSFIKSNYPCSIPAFLNLLTSISSVQFLVHT
jgi:hypothetical protein